METTVHFNNVKEIIVVNDDSADGAVKIAKRFTKDNLGQREGSEACPFDRRGALL